MADFLKMIGDFIADNPWWTILGIIGFIILLSSGLRLLRRVYAARSFKNRIFFRITMPREDSHKDKEKETEKDFREKISVMAQFYRNLEETSEMNLWNIIKTKLLKNNVFSLELVAEQKVVNFYVSSPKYYSDIVEKQITSYYPDAEVIQVEPYKHLPEGNKMKGYYAYLEKPYWFPIKTFKKIENDPLNDLSNIFSNMKEEETAVYQLVIRPRDGKWQKRAEKQGSSYFQGGKTSRLSGIPVLGKLFAILAGIVGGYEKYKQHAPKEDVQAGYVRMLQTKEEVAKSIGEKAQQAGFDTVLRILATAKTEERAENICNNMVVGLNLFKDPSMNFFQTKRLFFIDSLNDKLMLRNFEKRFLAKGFPFTNEKMSILAEDELASLFHFPHSKYNTSPTIRWLLYKVLPAPTDAPQEGILLGRNVYRGRSMDIHFADKDRSRHHYVIGKSGTGKSNFLSFMARQDIQAGKGICVIDPHGDLIEEIIQFVPKERAKDVIIFDPSDTERPMGLNILEAGTPAEMDLASSQATEIFIKLFGDEIFGPRIQHYFRNGCLTLMEDKDEGATLIDVPRIFVDEEFMRYKVKKVTNPVVKSFWKNEYANTGAREREEMIPYFSAKFGPFITNSIMRNTIGQTKSAFNFREIMDTGKILLVKLSKGKIGDLNTQLLGLVMVARIQMAAMSRTDILEKDRRDFYLYVDEFQSFATDSFCSILSEARKYHLCLIMAHQYINQLVTSKFGVTSTQIRDAVFGNVGSLSSFKVGADDAEYLAKEFAPLITEQDLVGISNYKQYVRLNINNTTSRPFSMDTIYDMKGASEKVGKIVKEYSRMKHGRKKAFVDQEITARIGISVDDEAVDVSKLPSLPNQTQAGNPMAKILAQAKEEAGKPQQAPQQTPQVSIPTPAAPAAPAAPTAPATSDK
ncbi:MAG: type IV secretion system DNA-binding domain-containing protein [Candidatus Gracilibacteria bacterium]